MPTILLGISKLQTQEGDNFPGATVGISVTYGLTLLILLLAIGYGYCCGGRTVVAAGKSGGGPTSTTSDQMAGVQVSVH